MGMLLEGDGVVGCWSFSGEVMAMWSSKPLNALECDPDRSSLELNVRNELNPESDLSDSKYDDVTTTVELELDEDDDNDCWSFDGITTDLVVVVAELLTSSVVIVLGYN